MGNNPSSIDRINNNTNGSFKSLMIQRKLKKENKKFEQFFVDYNRVYTISHKMDISAFNCKRTVFISINGLYQTWRNCPPISLYNAIFILPLKSEWIKSPNKYHHEYSNLLKDEAFLTILRWKQHQRLAIFMLDNDDIKHNMEINEICDEINMERLYDHDRDNSQQSLDDDNCLCAPIWRILSLRLQELMDPAQNNQKYKALNFDENYWKYNSNVANTRSSSTGYDYNLNKVSVDDIFLELYTVTMKFKSIKQILIESNPTLDVITHCIQNNEQFIGSMKTVSPKLYPAQSTIDPSMTSLILSPTTSLSTSSKSLSYSQMIQHHINVLPQQLEEMDDDQVTERVESDIVLSDDWWISSDYFDDDLEEETKALNEFYSFLNVNDDLQSDGIQQHTTSEQKGTFTPSPQNES